MLLRVLCLASAVALTVAQIGFGGIEEFGAFESKPYNFGYAIKDVHGEQHRHESRDSAGVVTGSYGFTDERGIHRIVQYIADHKGFRAKVITNEPGTAPMNPAGVLMESTQ